MAFTDADIAHLVKLQQLNRLRLARTLITGKGLALIKKMKWLRTLDLGQTKLSVEELCQLKGSDLIDIGLPEGSYSAKDMAKLKAALPTTRLCLEAQDTDWEPNSLFAPLHY